MAHVVAAALANAQAMAAAPSVPPVMPAAPAAPPKAPLVPPVVPPKVPKNEVEVILSDEERDVLEQRAEEMALCSLQALPEAKRQKALPAVKQGILKRLLSQASHDEASPAAVQPVHTTPSQTPQAAAPPPPPIGNSEALDECDDEELDRLRCSLRQAPRELPPPQDGVETFGDDAWFAPGSEVREALAEAVEAAHGCLKILVGDPAEEIARICHRRVRAGAVLRLGGASGGFGEADVAYAYRQLSRALHPDKNPDNPDAGEGFRRLKEAQEELKQSLDDQRRLVRRLGAPFRSRDEGEVQMKRPQCALLAEACRLLGAVLALTSQGVVPPAAQQRANAFLRLPGGHWAAATASTEALLAQWRSESGELLEVLAHDAMRTAYDCAPKRYRAHFLCLLARAAQVESDASDGCVRRPWGKVWEQFPEIQLWQKLRSCLLKKRQIHGRGPPPSRGGRKRDHLGSVKMIESDWSSWAKRWRKLIVAVLPCGEEEAAQWSDPELRKLLAALWRDFVDPLEKEEGEDAEATRRCLGLFRSESRKASDVERERGAAPAEWAFVPGSDLLLLLGEGLVGITVEGVFVSKDDVGGNGSARLPFASAIFQTMMSS